MDISSSDFILKEKDTSKEETLSIIKLLESFGICEYDNYTINCLKEFINSYIKDILKESKRRMSLSKREKISKEDLISSLYKKQYEMYKSRLIDYEKKSLERINMKELPPIPDSPVVLKPPVTNNLLRNNFQIYSDELNEILKEKNNQIKENEISMLGVKRNNKEINDINNKHKKEQKNKRKKSMRQNIKQNLQENSNKKEKEKDDKKIGNNISISSNSLINNEESLGSDNSDYSKEIGESTINKKEDEMNIEDEDDDNENNDDYEDEESEGNNDSNNNNDGNESS